MMVRSTRRLLLIAAAMFAALTSMPDGAHAGPARPARPVRPPRPERPTRIPRHSPTPTTVTNPAPTPTRIVGVGICPAAPAKVADARLWHLFWKYPGATKDLTGRAAFRVARSSNGLLPESEPASLALVNSRGEAIITMPNLSFTRTGSGTWAASTDVGYVVLQTMTGGYSVSFNFQNVSHLDLPDDFYTTGGRLCFSVGDEGIFERFVCQMKPGGGFLCHD